MQSPLIEARSSGGDALRLTECAIAAHCASTAPRWASVKAEEHGRAWHQESRTTVACSDSGGRARSSAAVAAREEVRATVAATEVAAAAEMAGPPSQTDTCVVHARSRSR
eukprot:6207946-Pleurochrysis_carterae.AAC.1